MIDRYQLSVAAVALVAGTLIAVIDRWTRSTVRPDTVTTWLSARSWAIAGLAGALIGGWLSPRSTPWWIAAVVVLLLPADSGDDIDRREHPLGRSVPVLALVGLVGVWSAMPDTEPAVATAFTLAPLALLTLQRHRAAMVGPAGTAALVVAVLGAAWVGSAGRIVGITSLAAVTLLVFTPVALGWHVVRSGPGRRAMIAAQVAVGLVLPRAVMQRSIAATVVATAVAATGLMVVAVLVRRDLDER